MANPRETRGWAVVALGGGVAYLAFSVRMWAIFASPDWPVPVHESLLIVALVGVAIAGVGLQQALWYFLVQADGMAMLGASGLLLASGTFLLFEIPAQTDSGYMTFLLVAALLEWMAVPLLSYRRRLALGLVSLLALAVVGLSTGLALLPPPFDAVVDPWGLSGLVAKGLGLLALGAMGNMLLVLNRVSPASERFRASS